jgi:hypothetical protein
MIWGKGELKWINYSHDKFNFSECVMEQDGVSYFFRQELKLEQMEYISRLYLKGKSAADTFP